MEPSAFLFQNSGEFKIRDQNSSIVCTEASDLKTTEARKLTEGIADQLSDQATEENLKL